MAAAPVAIKQLPPWHPAFWLATWFGSGLLKPAPGTWGSLAALPPAWLLVSFGGTWALVAAIVVTSLIGWWAAELYAVRQGKSDPGEVVIDEVVGQWMVLLLAPLDPLYYAVAFVLFRLFDIAKPWPVRWADRVLHGGLGIMLDDMLAAGYGLAILWLIRIWW